jgi:intracellular protein transport protein USO1
MVNGQPEPTRVAVNVIQALIDVAFAVSVQEPLDVRLAACECLKAYLQGHAPIRHFFLKRARDGHLSQDPEVDNIFTILIDDGSRVSAPDPYRVWIASALLFRLLFDDYDAKKVAMDIAEGDSEKGEEVVTCIQALSANLISNAQRGKDDRITVAYLTLLCGWLFEDPEAINDFLQEGSNVQNLIQLVLQPNPQRSLEAGLCAFLLGIIYEFSSKDSPIPRSKLHELLTSRLRRDQYNDRLTKLREHPSIRDFEVLPQGYVPDSYGGQPEIPFDKQFVEFLKDNFSRISRSLDREPGLEVPVVANGVQRGISRELVDSLKAQVEDKNSALQKAQSTVINLEQKLGQEQSDLRKVKETTFVELSRIKNVNEGLQRNHEQEYKDLQKRHEEEKQLLHQNRTRELNEQQRTYRTEIDRLSAEHQKALAELESNLSSKVSAAELEKEELKQQYESSSARTASQNEAAISKFTTRIKAMEDEATRSSEQHSRDLQAAEDSHNSRLEEQKRRLVEQERRSKELDDRLQAAETRAEKAEASAKKSEANAKRAETRVAEAEKAVQEKEAARASAQTELDDLFMVLADLEEKRAKDKVSGRLFHSHAAADMR